ncbi:MAG: hypothetical protein KAT06_03985 [Gammaproteobacteria bacterium]|nr:hypothetical protein [Gammaproteobacteria bacterium]
MSFLKPIKLLLPALIPSWNFFDVIAPSPRIQFALLKSEHDSVQKWQEFRPRPAQLSFSQMLKRMLWNPKWNESLFMVSCAERIMGDSTQQMIQHSENEILKRIENNLIDTNSRSSMPDATHLQFRLKFIQRQGTELHEEVTFHSRIQALSMVKAS